MPPTITRDALETLYQRFNHRECVHPDPVEFLYGYEDPLDREIVGIVAASLAYGRVAQIMRNAGDALGRLRGRTMPSSEDPACKSARPTRLLREASPESLERVFAGFKHRFATGDQLARLLLGLKRLIERHGSLGACFASHLKAADETVAPALGPFVREFRAAADGLESHLLPDPSRGSACKRLNLFLRWMVRRDEIDPGGWDGVSPARLIVPLDVHMHRICGSLGLTKRAAADLRAALEITAAFRAFDPDDPVRYDFAISHLGIRGEGDILLSQRDG